MIKVIKSHAAFNDPDQTFVIVGVMDYEDWSEALEASWRSFQDVEEGITGNIYPFVRYNFFDAEGRDIGRLSNVPWKD